MFWVIIKDLIFRMKDSFALPSELLSDFARKIQRAISNCMDRQSFALVVYV